MKKSKPKIVESEDNIDLGILNEILKHLRLKYIENQEGANCFQTSVFVGEIDDYGPFLERQAVIDYLKDKKIITEYKLKRVDFGSEIDHLNEDDYEKSMTEPLLEENATYAICNISKKELAKCLRIKSLLPKFYVKIKKTREIVLNDQYILRKPNFQSENEKIFKYLYNHPNRIIMKKELEKFLGETLRKALRQTVQDLNFTGELKKIFFPAVSQNAILFRREISRADIERDGINERKLNAELKEQLKDGNIKR